MKFDKPLPEWKKEGLEPPASKRNEGWKEGDRPPAEWWNWQMNTTYEALKELQEKSVTEQGLDERVIPIEAQLTKADQAKILLREGVQAVNVLSDSGLQMKFEGRTLVNILGREGRGKLWDDLSSYQYGKQELTTTNAVIGEKCIRIYDVGTGNRWPSIISKNLKGVISGKKIIVSAYLKSDIVGSTSFHIKNSNTVGSPPYTKSVTYNVTPDKMNRYFGLFDLSDSADYDLYFWIGGHPNSWTEIFIDGICLYILTDEEYIKARTMSKEELSITYPYVDSVQHTRNPFAIVQGKNICPTSVDKWEQGTINTLNGRNVETTNRLRTKQLFKIAPSTNYIATTREGYTVSGVALYDKDFNFIVSEYAGFTSTADTAYAKVIIRREDFTDISPQEVLQAKLQLELGEKATPFQEHQETYLFGVDVTLAKGEKAYRNSNGEWRKWQEWEQITLDGSLEWSYQNKVTGYKIFRTSLAYLPYLEARNSYLVKYDGKILPRVSIIGNNSDAYNNDLPYFYISIPNQDSGWGPDYAPTSEERKAYFLGWKMYDATSSRKTVYNGTGAQGWVKLTRVFDDLPLQSSDYTTTLPTQPAGTDSLGNTFTPYQLHYKLEKPREVPAKFEGSLRVHEGLNQVWAGSGVIVREHTVPRDFGDTYDRVSINARSGSNINSLTYRVEHFLRLYKNETEDNRYYLTQHNIESRALLGLEQLNIPKTEYDPTAAYSVTYLALDLYKLSAGLGTVEGKYNTNIATRVDDHDKRIVVAERKITVIENEYARKQQGQWIPPVSLNGWVNTTAHLVGVYKDEFDTVHCFFSMGDGAVERNTRLTILPEGYRPGRSLYVPAITYDGPSNFTLAVIGISPLGNVFIESRNVLSNLIVTCSFRAEL